MERGFSANVAADGLSFTVELAQATDLYRLTDWLRDVNGAVDAISRVIVDFEQVFRRLVNGHELNGRAAGSAGAGEVRDVVA